MIKLTELITEKYLHESINPGSKQYVNSNLTDEDLISLVKLFAKHPHTRLNTRGPEIQWFFKDIANMLGLPKSPIDVVTYTDSKAYVDKNKIKMKPNNAMLFKLYKNGTLSMSEYGSLQKPLYRKYIQVAKLYTNSNTMGSY